MEIAVVTGTSTGIGFATSVHLARHGYRVFAGMRNPGKADPLRAVAAEANLAIEVIPLDVTSTPSVTRAFETVSGHDPVDVLVNNAGIGGATRSSSHPRTSTGACSTRVRGRGARAARRDSRDGSRGGRGPRRRVHPRRGGRRLARRPRADLRARVRGSGRRCAAPDVGRSRALELRTPPRVGARAAARAHSGAPRGARPGVPAAAAGAGGDGGDAGAVRDGGRRVTIGGGRAARGHGRRGNRGGRGLGEALAFRLGLGAGRIAK
ncbi:MAG: SDR family NAD(P)-dependent oxidoreductase [Actinobacteria bacterium]|nr:MAG: SDR family NAD(P)-dependent oxidoreductase [Actinomycetota bacterium]